MRTSFVVAVASLLLAACQHDRVLFTLRGDVTGATELELVLADPLASPRAQRIATPGAPTADVERVYYVAQHASVRYPLDPAQSLAGVQVQIDVPDRAALLPIAIAYDGGGRIVGIGSFAGAVGDQIFVDGATPAAALQADVTHYELAIEPVVERAGGEPGLGPGQVAVVDCDGARSGIAWRRKRERGFDQHQLRIVLPLDDADGSAVARLDHAVDLDCDEHSPGVAARARDLGDQLDCDDLDAATGPSVEERCNGYDDNCDNVLPPAQIVDGGDCPAPPGCPNLLLCDEASGRGEICPTQSVGCSGGLRCAIPYRIVDENTRARRPCDSTEGTFVGVGQMNPCEAGCKLMLVDHDARWDIRIGTDASPDHGVLEPFSVGPNQQIHIRAKSAHEFGATEAGGTFTVYVEAAMFGPAYATFQLDFADEPSDCSLAPRFACGGTP